MLIPVLIFVAGLATGAMACSRWLPDLAAGSVGELAFFAVCGLVGTAAGLLGVHIYSIVNDLDHLTSGEIGRGEIVAGGLQSIAFEVGSLLSFAGIVYLLAPAPDEDDELKAEPAA